MAMPTQRPPFFASIFGAFRARTSPTFQAKSSAPSPALPSSIAATTATSTTSRSITSSNTDGTSSQIQQSLQTSQLSQPPSNKTPSPFSASAFTSTSPGGHHSHSPFYSPRSPGTSSPTGGQTIPLQRGRQRRGSDSSNSSGGFMDALGGGNEKWYIGGRTAGGDERFYRLGLVTSGGARGSRATSLDRLSL